MKKTMLLLLFCVAVLGQASLLYGQSPMEQTIAASFPLTKATADRTDIVTAGAVMTLKKDNVIMFATTASSKASLNYKDGKISPSVQTRMAAFSLLGRPATNIVQRTYVAGEKLWLIGVQAAGDGVTLQFLSDPAGDVRYAASIKFPFPKGTTPTSQQVIAQIGEVIAADGGAAPAAPVAPTEAPIIAPPPPGGRGASAGSAWRVQGGKGGNEAAIGGVGSVNGRQGQAVMALSCAGAEVRVRRSVVPDPQSLECMGDMDGGNDAVKFSVGQRPLEAGSICTEDVIIPPAAVMRLPIDLGAGGMDEVLASPGSPMVIRIAFSDKAADEFIATFQLPQDASAIGFLHSCSKVPEDGDQATVSSCPILPGKGLRDAKLLTASGKPYKGPDTDNDIGAEWLIPKATKSHPVRPKLTFACYYGVGLKPGDPNEPLEKKLVPISPRATECTARGDTTLGELSASCS